MDKVTKEEADYQDQESSQASNCEPVAKPCVKLETSSELSDPPTKRHRPSASNHSHPSNTQGEKSHATHSFSWQWKNGRTTCTCNQAGTVEEVLKRSPAFTKIAGQNEGKELVFLKNGKAISSHTPCRLIVKDEQLIVKYIKAVDEPKPLDRAPRFKYGEPVMFHVLTRGGENIVVILRNTALKKVSLEVTVYAHKGEKVKHALRRDGRFRDEVFKKNWALFDTSTDVTTEMSSLVDDLDGKTFKIILLDKCPPPESQPGSLDDAYMMQNDSPRSDSDVNQDPPQQSATTESENDSRQKEKPEPEGDTAPEQIPREIPNSTTMRSHLATQFTDLVKGTKTQVPKLSRVQNLFRVDYGKNDQTCREVKTMKKLMELSNFVCHVRINGRAEGSGFLLFDKFVLTNGHVIKNIYDEETRQLTEKVTVHFSYESLDQMEGGQDSRAEVEEVAGFAYYSGEAGHQYDWALLKLCAEQNLPDGLLTHFGFLPESGGICIIGHPDGRVKMIEPCLIVSFDDRCQVVDRHQRENPGHIQWVTPRFFKDVSEFINQNKQVLTYESSFYFGSSGSPVFDEHCNVVAMHSAGYIYHNARGQRQSVIEYGYPLSLIIEQVIYQLVERGRFDVLKKYLACSYERHQNMMSNLKKLVEGRNLTAFRNAANSPEVRQDVSLKKFFEFLCRPEEPVPMDFECSQLLAD
ncbi:protein FAM111A-like [Sparus aurata]|uniref:Protein FAM111A-like n=1 Tax=Sparus aurata TaxID=8175 RepID=A0A671VMC5_SPAAU|nr:protein FAM111A-like [Sparus aurata]XP_030294989.1 protein FAM111A-like [Sparus aurata]XP_030294990.1 protein FAM111A-like [Sparus aurata]XP_030294992.1 protein FAM111A-like [Sparus aurata]XP_030294993.1 protein FAM111A-like [Sparus aurata]